MPSFHSELEQPYKLFTAVGFGVEKPGVDALLAHARDAAYSAHSKADIQLAPDKQQVSVTNGEKSQSLSYSVGTKYITGAEKGVEYDVYANGNQTDASHVKLSMPTFFAGGKQNFEIHADGKTITGTCNTTDDITTCKQEVKDAQGNLLLRGMSISDIYKNPNKFNQVTDYTDAAGRPLGKIASVVEYDSEKANIKVDSTTTK